MQRNDDEAQAGGQYAGEDPDSDEARVEFMRRAMQADAPRGLCGKLCRGVQLIVTVPLLLPLRIIVTLITVFLLWLAYRVPLHCCLCRCSSSRDATLAPHTRAECMALRITIPLYRLLLFLVGIVWVRNRRPGVAATAVHANCAVVSNHVSAWDACLLGMLLGCQMTGVAKAWVTKVPICATIARAHHVLALNAQSAKVAPYLGESSGGGHAKTATDQLSEYQRACAADTRLVRVLVFPEGTTHATDVLYKFRTGVFVAGLPVQPVVVRFPRHMGWSKSILSHVIRCLTQFASCVEVVWLPVHAPSSDERQDPQLFANNVQASMAAALALPEELVSRTIGGKEVDEWLSKGGK